MDELDKKEELEFYKKNRKESKERKEAKELIDWFGKCETKHELAIQRKCGELVKVGYIVETEWHASNKKGENYYFDIIAFNPFSKDVVVVEIEYTHPTPNKKIKFIKSFARFERIRIKEFKDSFIKDNFKLREVSGVLKHKVRYTILKILSGGHARPNLLLRHFNDIEPSLFFYQIKLLIKMKLVKKEKDDSPHQKYTLTNYGKKIMKWIEKFPIIKG